MGKLRDRKSHEPDTATELVVRKRKLDTLVATDGLPDPDLVKLDVEGAEAAVLDGAVEVLQRARPALLIELHSANHAVAERLGKFSFVGRLLGSRESFRTSLPDATVAAAPEKRVAMLNQVSIAWGSN